MSDVKSKEEREGFGDIKMAAGGHQGFVAGTECVGKFNFIGSAAHVSYFITYTHTCDTYM